MKIPFTPTNLGGCEFIYVCTTKVKFAYVNWLIPYVNSEDIMRFFM